jgi:hypothetical protein
MNSLEKNLMSIFLIVLLDFLPIDANKFKVPVGIDSSRGPESGTSSPFIVVDIGLFVCFVRIFDKFVAFVKESGL